MTDEREAIARRLAEADVDPERFIRKPQDATLMRVVCQ